MHVETPLNEGCCNYCLSGEKNPRHERGEYDWDDFLEHKEFEFTY